MTKARDLADLGNKTSLDEINDAYDAGALSNRNMIINGAMQVAQRGTSFTHTNVGAGTLYCLDRFKMQSDLPAMAYTVTQAQDGPSGTGLVNSFKLTVNTPASSFPDNANRYFRVRHSIEAQDIQHLVNKPCTLSFWVKSSITGQFDVTAFALDISGNNHFVAPYTINTANTWEKKEISLTGPAVIDNNNEAGLDIQFQIAKSGTGYQTSSTGVWGSTKLSSTGSTSAVATTANATWQITGVQLEVGDTATPFEHRSYGDELAKCQRYFQAGAFARRWTSNGSNEYNFFTHYYVTQMRASPTRTFTGGSFNNIIGSSENSSDEILSGTACQISYRANATNADTFVFGRDVTFDAEL